MKNTPIIAGLCIYPVKSFGAIHVNSSLVDEFGLQYDRRWMVVDANGKFLTQREFPQMAAVQCAFDTVESRQVISCIYHSMQYFLPLEPSEEKRVSFVTVRVWESTVEAIDEGDRAAEWISEVLSTRSRIVRMPTLNERQNFVQSQVHARYTSTKYLQTAAPMHFGDGYPIHLISRASVNHISQNAQTIIPENRYRANIIIEGVDPYEEDTFKEFTINNSHYTVAKKASRCIITTIDQSTGNKAIGVEKKEPLATLNHLRRNGNAVEFGIYCAQTSTDSSSSILRCGDRINVLLHQDRV